MGTWGENNFENDAALDFLQGILRDYVSDLNKYLADTEIQEIDFLEMKGEYKALPLIDILVTICQRYSVKPPLELSTVAEWKNKYLQTFDEDEDIYPEELKSERRSVIKATFEKLESVVSGEF